MKVSEIIAEYRKDIDEAIEKYIPRKYDEKSLEETLLPPTYEYDEKASTKAIAEPIWDLLDRGGKRWRPVLMFLVYEALSGKDYKEIIDFAVIPEVVHNGTLMIDDIEDSSSERRGKPCTYKVFGNDIAINAGNTMYYLPLLVLLRKKMPQEKKLKIYETYAQEMINLSFGQATDIYWHKGNFEEVNEKKYLQMCAYKTGCLVRIAAKIGAILADASEKEVNALSKYAEAIAVAFQIQDDILNLTGEEFAKGKGLGEDIHEGKITLMVLHCLKNSSKKDGERLKQILKSHPSDEKTILEAIELIKKTNSVEYAKEFARKIVRDSWKQADTLLKESPAKNKLKAFADYLVEREI